MKTEFEESGAILDVDLLAALVALWRAGASGSLRFSRGAVSAGFDLLGGEVVGVSSSEPRFETSAILVRAGKLDSAALDRLSVAPGGDAALAALQAGILTRREWKWGEKIRGIEILADVLGWSDGTYTFDADARPAAADFTLTVPRLVLELFLRSRDRHLVEHQLGATDVALARSEDFDDLFPTFGLTADAESVVRLIDGQSSAAEIQQRAPADEFAVAKLLAALTTLGLIRAGGAAGEPAGGAASPQAPFRAIPAAPEPPFDDFPPPEVSDWPSAPPDEEPARETLAEPPAALPVPPAPAGIGQPHDPDLDRDVAAHTLDAPLSEAAEESDSRDALMSSWSEPPGGSPELFSSEPGIPPEPAERPRRRGPGLLLTGLIFFLGAAILVVILLRSRAVTVPGASVAAGPTAAAEPVATVPAPAPTSAPAVTIPPAETASAPGSSSRRRAEATARRATAPPAAATPRPTAAPERANVVPEKAAPPGSREEWVRRAKRDQKRLASERGTRYAVQLELACEVPSLVDAWKHDRPAGSMWLLPVSHRGRDCFRVLWGRYPTLGAARSGKGKVPAFFTTASNHPAVVSVR